MKTDKLTKKQLTEIFDGKVREARMPPRVEPENLKPTDPADLLYISGLKKELAKRLGWKLRPFDPQGQDTPKQDNVPLKAQTPATGQNKGQETQARAETEEGPKVLDTQKRHSVWHRGVGTVV